MNGVIELGFGWYCTVDAYSYTLAKKVVRKKKDGTEEIAYPAKSYHATLAKCLKAFKEEVQRDELMQVDTLDEAIRTVIETNRKVDDLIERVLR